MNGPAVDVIVVPWDCGRRGWRMGAGPLRLVERVLERLGALGLDARAATIELPPGASEDDAGIAFALAAGVADHVRRARAGRRFPVVLAGNCSSALGTVAGMDPRGTGVVWFDAHADFNTPVTSASGFLDGMSVAMLTGRCQAEACGTIPGFRPVADDALVLVGTRDIDAGERPVLESSGVRVVGVGSATSEELAAAVEAWPDAAVEAYLHVDLDVLDPGEAIANDFAAAGGLALTDLLTCIDAVATHVPLGAAAITALDPDADPAGRALAAAITVIEQIVARAEPGGAA